MRAIGTLFPTNSPPIRELERLQPRSMYRVEPTQPCSGWVGPLPRIYLDTMCPNVGNHPGMSLEACKQQCTHTPRCNAMTFSPGGGCSLRTCHRGAGMTPTGPQVKGSFAYHMQCPAPSTDTRPSWHRSFVFDFGQNMLGRVTLKLPANHGMAPGTAIRLEHSELVQCNSWAVRPGPDPSPGSDPEAVTGSPGLCSQGSEVSNVYCQPYGSRVNFSDLDQNHHWIDPSKTAGSPGFASSLRWEPCASAQIMGIPTRSADRIIGDFNCANQTNVYIVRGDGQPEEYRALFAMAGFRYVSVSGFPAEFTPSLGLVEAGFVHSDVPRISNLTIADVMAEGNGSLHTPNVLARIHQAYLYSQQSNLFSIPTDCPRE